MSGFHPYQAVLRQQLEMRELEEVFEQDDLKCEINHRKTACTVEVTHRIVGVGCPGRDVNVCTNAADYKKARQERGVRCADCQRPARDCWVIRAI